LIAIKQSAVDLDTLMEIALENGADDVTDVGDLFEITCTPDMYTGVVDAIESRNIEIEIKQVTRIPSNTVDVDSETAVAVMKLLEQLEDHDDIQSVASNVNFTEEQLASFG
jgi:transcriptional/translational regulatory protein YebC/TACO1